MMPPGSVVILDHKTTSKDINDAVFWDSLRIDAQVSNYMRGAASLGMAPTGAIWDAVRKPRIKREMATPEADRKYTKATKKEPSRLYATQRDADETLDEYRMRLRADIEGNPDVYYRRGYVVRSQQEEHDAALDVWGVASQITYAAQEEQWPRNPSSCVRYNKKCPYWSVCVGESSLSDGLRFRKSSDAHEELAPDGKHHLPLVTTSGIKTFQRCAREYQIAYVKGYRPLEQADALAFGTLVHTGLEVWWKTVDVHAAMAAVVTNNELHTINAQEMIRGYHARWCEEPFDVLAVEAQFRMPVEHPLTGQVSTDWDLGGKIDAIARVTG